MLFTPSRGTLSVWFEGMTECFIATLNLHDFYSHPRQLPRTKACCVRKRTPHRTEWQGPVTKQEINAPLFTHTHTHTETPCGIFVTHCAFIPLCLSWKNGEKAKLAKLSSRYKMVLCATQKQTGIVRQKTSRFRYSFTSYFLSKPCYFFLHFHHSEELKSAIDLSHCSVGVSFAA